MSCISFFKNGWKLCGASNIKYFTRTMTHCVDKLTNRSAHGDTYGHTQGGLAHKQLCASLSPSFALRFFSSNASVEKEKKSGYHELYLFEKIRFMRILGRFAKYSCLSFAIGPPVCGLAVIINLMSLETLVAIVSNLSFYCALFTGQSFIFSSRLIGKLMISDDERTIKISHLSLFGDRKDLYIKPSEVVPVSDAQSKVLSKKMAFVKLKNSKQFIFLPDMGGIDTNFEVIELILTGDLKGGSN